MIKIKDVVKFIEKTHATVNICISREAFENDKDNVVVNLIKNNVMRVLRDEDEYNRKPNGVITLRLNIDIIGDKK